MNTWNRHLKIAINITIAPELMRNAPLIVTLNRGALFCSVGIAESGPHIGVADRLWFNHIHYRYLFVEYPIATMRSCVRLCYDRHVRCV